MYSMIPLRPSLATTYPFRGSARRQPEEAHDHKLAAHRVVVESSGGVWQYAWRAVRITMLVVLLRAFWKIMVAIGSRCSD
eukprot:15251416-Heterocapsa_arctica.AAC.1